MPRHAATPKRSGRERALLVGMGVAVVAVIGAIVAGVILALRMNVAAPTVTAQTSSAAPSATAAVPGPTATEPTAADVARPDVPPAAMGQEVRDGDFSFVVTGVQRMDAVVNPEHPDIEKTAQGEYVVVQMTVTNTSAEPQTYSGSFNTLSDGGTVYKSDDEAWLYFGHLPPRLNSGDSFDTAVVFDVPRGTEVQSVDLHDGPTSTGVTVAL